MQADLYIKLWIEHIDELYRLKWHLQDKADRDQLDNAIKTIKSLVATASVELGVAVIKK